MTNSRSTKSALFTSVVAILLCCTMLLGTTFAWFTDTATSANNVITAGNLDIDVQYTTDGETWKNLDGATDVFNPAALWEPGHTEVVVLKVENKGNLATKVQANMNIVEETIGKTKDGRDIKLSDILTVSSFAQGADATGDFLVGLAFYGEEYVQYSNTTAFKDANVLGAELHLTPKLPNDHPDAYKMPHVQYVFIKVDMAETVGNEANHDGTHAPSINFGINVKATQDTVESDSFDNQYDKDATYPEYDYNPPVDAIVTPLTGDKLTIPVRGIQDANGQDVDEVTLDVAYQFVPEEEYDENNLSPYRWYHADFVVKANKPVPANSIALAGYYVAYCDALMDGDWFALTSPVDIAANQEIRLIEVLADELGWDITVNYEALTQYSFKLDDGTVLTEEQQGFHCGAVDLKDITGVGVADGTTLTVELRLYETTGDPATDDGPKNIETGSYITVGHFEHKF